MGNFNFVMTDMVAHGQDVNHQCGISIPFNKQKCILNVYVSYIVLLQKKIDITGFPFSWLENTLETYGLNLIEQIRYPF